MTSPQPVDQLPPEARFALRAVAAGLPIDEAGLLMRLDGATVRKHLRTAARDLTGSAPPPSAGDGALLTALAPAFVSARETPSRASSTRCPKPDVLAALAANQLDGPLMLAEIDHAADCVSCLTRLIELRRAGAVPIASAPVEPASRWPVVVGVLVGVGAAAWWLFR